jgi:hypothetical protein
MPQSTLKVKAPALPRFDILDRERLFAMEPPAWLIEGVYVQDGLCQIYGDPSSYKTFLALAVGCSVATGKPFLGKIEPGRVGDVVYISAEGGRGIGKRLRAWETANGGCEADRFFAIAEPVDLLHDAPELLIADIRGERDCTGVDLCGYPRTMLRRGGREQHQGYECVCSWCRYVANGIPWLHDLGSASLRLGGEQATWGEGVGRSVGYEYPDGTGCGRVGHPVGNEAEGLHCTRRAD